ncbi:MAG: glycosyltransferase family 4 protein [Bradymonadaceae bacterium]
MAEPGPTVLVTADTVGGVWTYTRVLVDRLVAADVEVVVAAMGGEPSESSARWFSATDGVELYAADYDLEWMPDPWDDVEAAGDWLMAICRHTDPDLIHLNNFAHGTLNWARPVLMVGHSCVLSWFRAVEDRAAPPRFDTYRRRVEAGLQAADVVASPTRAMLSALQRHYGPFAKTRVVYNGLAPEPFESRPAEPFVLTAGRLWDAAKNVGAVRRIARELSWPVFVAGRQQAPDGRRVSLEGIEPLGHLDHDELLDWYARAGIYALPARYEPFGLTPLEAGLSGCALVLGDIASLREVWGEAALFVDPDAPGELAEAIETLIGDGDLRREMGRRAARRARRYGADQMGQRYLELYRQLDASPRPDSP